MLWHNKDKHLHDMSQTVGVKCPLYEVDGSASLPITTASILEKTTTDTDLNEVDGSAATPITTANTLEETTTNVDPSEVEGSAAPTTATASILEKTRTNTNPSEVDGSEATTIATTNILEETTTTSHPSEVEGLAAPKTATASILEKTTTNVDPSEVDDGSAAPSIATASISGTTTDTEHAMDSFIANGSCSPREEGHLNSIVFVSVTSDDVKQRNINAIYSKSNASLAVDHMSLASIPMFIGDDSLMFDNLLDQTSSFSLINPIDNLVPDKSNINFFTPSLDLNYASSTNPLSNRAMSYYSNNVASSLLLLSKDQQPFSSPCNCKVLFSPNIFELPSNTTDTALAIIAKLEHNAGTPEVLQGLALLHDCVTNTFILPSPVNDDILHRVDHCMMLISIPNKAIIDEF